MKLTFTLTGKKLAAAAVVLLAVVLAMASTVTQGTGSAPVGTGGVVQSIVQQTDHVTPGELAQWIMEKRQDYQLIDLRDAWQYDDYHIPTAINIPIAQFFNEDNLKRLDRGKKTVVYGLGAGHAAQAQVLLALKGYKAYSLREGISAWWENVMTPTSLRVGTTSPAGYQQAKQIRDYFMGTAPSGQSAAAPAQPLPQVPPPTAAPEGGSQAPAKKLKLGQGCS
jgi:rhodanese-related sulfurtransferase